MAAWRRRTCRKDATRSGGATCSAWWSSIDSITAEAWASSSLRPLPCETDRQRALGRMHNHTGMPMRSSPVMLASRVMPNAGSRGWTRASVCRGEQWRNVPPRSSLAVPDTSPEVSSLRGDAPQSAAFDGARTLLGRQVLDFHLPLLPRLLLLGHGVLPSRWWRLYDSQDRAVHHAARDGAEECVSWTS